MFAADKQFSSDAPYPYAVALRRRWVYNAVCALACLIAVAVAVSVLVNPIVWFVAICYALVLCVCR